MRKNIVFPLLAFLILSIGCSDDNTKSQRTINTAFTNEITSSESGYRLFQFIEEGVDKTTEFEGFTFQFLNDNSVIATRENVIINGTFSVFNDDGKTELSMIFPSNSMLNEFTDDWYFVSENNGRKLFSDNNCRLVLERN